MDPRVDVTVVGGGPVGLFAAFYAGLRGMSVRVIDSLPELGGQLSALYPEKLVFDMPGFPEVLARDLAAGMAKQGTQFGADVVLEDTAETLTKDADGYTIGTRGGKVLPTRTVIISAGAGAFSPTKIGVDGEDEFVGRGLTYGVRDKQALAGKRIAVVGGGDSAFDWVLNLHPIAAGVSLIHRSDRFRAHEDSVAKARSHDIDWRLFCEVKELQGADQLEAITLEDNRTKERTTIKCEALVVNIGFKSSLGPLQDWGLEIVKQTIAVNHRFETTLPGVYAVGDVCSYEGKLKLIATGCGEAASAVCYAKTFLDPSAKLFPGHSSDMELPPRA